MGNFVSINKSFSLKAPIDANEVGPFLSKLGTFTPTKIVTIASNSSSPLHKYFEWDDRIAAHGYRVQQARHLILSIGIESNGGVIRSFESIVIDNSRLYMPTDQIKGSQELVDQVLQSVMRELLFWKQKHQQYQNFFSGVFEAIDNAEEELVKHEKKKISRGLGKTRKVRNPSNKKVNRNDNNRRRFSASR